MRQHLVAAIRNGAHGLRRTFCNDRIHHDARLGAMVCQPVHQAVDADFNAVRRPGNRHRVERSGRKRITHWTDARRFAVRPGFEADIEDDGDALTSRPSPMRPSPIGLFHLVRGTKH
jgi:hypothetical protein